MGTAAIQTIPFSPESFQEPGFRYTPAVLNRRLDHLTIPSDVNEAMIVAMLEALEGVCAKAQGPGYWLLLARLTELALLVAGHYADHCEFSAAGDLLINPRAVQVCFGQQRPEVKKRHGRLSDQFRPPWLSHDDFLCRFKESGSVETVRPALLPALTGCLVRGGCFTDAYMETVNGRMKKIADTIRFLCAGGIASGRQLYLYLNQATAGERDLFEENLCRFSRIPYDRVGREVDQWLDETVCTSVFIKPEAGTPAFFDERNALTQGKGYRIDA